MLKNSNFLFRAILEYAEIFLFQVPDRTVFLIRDIHVHFGEIHVDVEFERVFLRPKKRRHNRRHEQ